jgi:hypothetical protein
MTFLSRASCSRKRSLSGLSEGLCRSFYARSPSSWMEEPSWSSALRSHTARAWKASTKSTIPSCPSTARSVFPNNDSDSVSRRPFGLGADWMNDHADGALPWALECAMTLHLSNSLLSNFSLFFFVPQPTRAQIRYDLLHLDAAPKCCAVDVLQRTRPRPRRSSLAVGYRAHTGALLQYAKQGPIDYVVVPRLGVAQRGIRWTLARLEPWITERYWPMEYTGYLPPQKQ